MSTLIKTAALIAATATAGTAGAETLIFGHHFPPSHAVFREGVQPFLDCIAASDADINISHFPSGQITNARETVEALNNGVAQMTIVNIGYSSSKLPLNNVSMLPGVGASAADISRGYTAAIAAGGVLADEFAANNIYPIWVAGLPVYQIASTGDPMKTLDAIKGRVLRSAGGSMNMTIQLMGGSPAEMPITDAYVAMERGAVDGILASYSSLAPYDLDSLITSVSDNASFGTFTIAASVSTDTWEKLSPDQQTVLNECGGKARDALTSALDAETEQHKADFLAKGIDVFSFTPENLAQVNAAISGVAEDWATRLEDRGLPAREALALYTAQFD